MASHCGIAALAVADDLADDGACQGGKNVAPESAVAGHGVAYFRMPKAVALDVICFVGGNGLDKGLEIQGVHLPVARHHNRNIVAVSKSIAITAHDRRADTFVLRLPQDDFFAGRLGSLSVFDGAVLAGIVNDDEAVNTSREAFDDLLNPLFFIECGNDHRHALIADHSFAITWRWASP